MVVYIDLIFLANLFIDAVLLMVTAWMRKIRPVWWRLMVSSWNRRNVRGHDVCAGTVLFIYVPDQTGIIGHNAAGGFWIWQHAKVSSYNGCFLHDQFCSCRWHFGDALFSPKYGELFNGIWYTASGGMSFELKIAFWFILFAFGGVMLFFRIVQSSKQRTERMSGFLGQVQVWIGQDHIECTGLLDTGNQLYDPLTRTPVMVMEAALWESYLPASWLRKCSEGNADQLVMELGDESFSWQDRVRLVPYRGINRSHSFMLALKPDRVEVVMNGAHFVHHRVLIGLDGGTLSAEGKYRAIIHPDVTAQEEGSADTNQKRDAHFSEHFTESG